MTDKYVITRSLLDSKLYWTGGYTADGSKVWSTLKSEARVINGANKAHKSRALGEEIEELS